jgi:PIN domain nuclease of toxin-antitoxin system
MDLLVDTQAFLWFENGDARLSQVAKDAISNPSNRKFLSIASFWEIAIKDSLGKLQLKMHFDELLLLNGYEHLQISTNHLSYLRTLPNYHRDPFDRILIAQTLHEQISIISSDNQFDVYGVKRVW